MKGVCVAINCCCVANIQKSKTLPGSCLKSGQHLIFVIIYLLLPIKYIFFIPYQRYCLNLYKSIIIIIMILIMKILLHYVYKIITK